MSRGISWSGGDFALRAAVERQVAGEREAGERTAVLRRHHRRRLVRLEFPSPGEAGHRTVIVKHFGSAAGSLRARIKHWLGLSPARREWRALRRLRAAGVPVPEPLARATLPDGAVVIVTHCVEGRALAQALPSAAKSRRALLVALGGAVARLHAAGFVHGDLHHGNVLVGEPGPVLLDFQRTRRAWTLRARRRDLGFLDASLATRLSAADRLRLRTAALGLRRPYGARERRSLRAVGRAAWRRVRARAASRTRRALRPGRRFAALRLGRERGLRVTDVDEATVASLRAAHRRALAEGTSEVIKDDGRSRVCAVRCGEQRAVVKEVTGGGPARHLADLVRRSPARRAWLGGHGLRSRGIEAARPLAFLERRRAGVPVSSLVMLEALCTEHSADRVAARPEHAERLLDALRALVLRLHRYGVRHGDLKASHVILSREGDGWRTSLLDLEGMRFRRRLSSAERILALAQLNASLPDAVPAPARRIAFARYARALPFPGGNPAALRRIVELSLARRHRWSGADCGWER